MNKFQARVILASLAIAALVGFYFVPVTSDRIWPLGHHTNLLFIGGLLVMYIIIGLAIVIGLLGCFFTLVEKAFESD